MATEKPEHSDSSITTGNISNASSIAIGHGAQVHNITNIIQGYGELFTRYDINVRNFLEYYVGTSEKPVPFGGREQDLRVLDRWLTDPQAPHYALLAAPAGRGKSALLAQWVTALESHPQAPHIIFFPVSLRFETHLESVAFAALAARAGHLFDEKVANLPDFRQYRSLFADFLRRPHPDGRPTLVILDGLDEAAGWTIGADVFPPTPWDHLKVLVAARPLAGDVGVRGWLQRLGWDEPGKARLISLDNLTREGLRDVLLQMGNPLDSLAADFGILGALYHVTEGDPLLVRLYVDALLAQKGQAPLFKAEDVRTIEPGLEGFFKRWFEEQQKLWGDKTSLKDKGVRGLLNLCAAAVGPLSNDDVLTIEPDPFEGDTFLVQEAAKDLNRFVIGDGVRAGYVFSHPRLREYFAGRLAEGQRRAWQERFVKYGSDTLQALRNKKLAPKKASSYVLQYYSAHLKQTGAPAEAFYELVCQPWAQAWLEFDGTYSGFLNDVGRAWDLAEKKDDLYIQLLSALCFSSVASQSGNISAELLTLAVKEGLFSIRQALVMIEQQSDFNKGFGKIRRFSEELVDDQLREGFKLTLGLGGWLPLWGPVLVTLSRLDTGQDSAKSRDYVALMPPQTWELAERQLKNKNVLLQAIALAGLYLCTRDRAYLSRLYADESPYEKLVGELSGILGPYLPPDLLARELDKAHAIEQEGSRAGALIRLAPHLPADLLLKAYKAAQDIQHDGSRAETLTAQVPHLPEPLRQDALNQALAAARNIPHALYQAEVLTGLIPHLSEPRRRAVLDTVLDATLNIGNSILDGPYIERIFHDLASQLPPELLGKAFERVLNALDKGISPQILASLAPHLPPELLHKAFDTICSISPYTHSERELSEALLALVPHLPPYLLQSAFSTIQNVEDPARRTQLLAALVPQAAEPLRQHAISQALEAGVTIQDETTRAEILTALVPHLSGPLRQEALEKALEAAQDIQDDHAYIKAMLVLVPHLSGSSRQEALDKALEAAQNIHEELIRADVLKELAPHLPPDLLSKALKVSQTIQYGHYRTGVLAALTPYLPPEVLYQALEGIQNLQYEASRADALVILAPYLPPDLLSQVFEIAQNIQDNTFQIIALKGLVPYLPGPLQQAAISTVLEAAERQQDPGILTDLIPYLPEDVRQAALNSALEAAIRALVGFSQLDSLLALSPYLSEPRRQAALDQALDAIQNIKGGYSRIEALRSLVPHLPPELLGKALEAVQRIQDEYDRTRALLHVVPHLPPELLGRVLETADNLPDEINRANTLTYLIPDLSGPVRQAGLDKALDAARRIQHQGKRAELLTSLIPYLPEPLRQEALNQALDAVQKTEEYSRAAALERLVPLVPPALLDKALEAAQNIRDEGYRAQALSCLALPLGPQLIHEMIELAEKSLSDNRTILDYILVSLKNQPVLSVDFKKECLRKIIRRSSKLSRPEILELVPALFTLVCSTRPEAEHPQAAEQFTRAILNVGEWWP